MSARENCELSNKRALLKEAYPGQDGFVILARLIARKHLGQKLVPRDGYTQEESNTSEHDNIRQGEVH